MSYLHYEQISGSSGISYKFRITMNIHMIRKGCIKISHGKLYITLFSNKSFLKKILLVENAPKIPLEKIV